MQQVDVHQDRFVVAVTDASLLLHDWVNPVTSELPWQQGARASLCFDYPEVGAGLPVEDPLPHSLPHLLFTCKCSTLAPSTWMLTGALTAPAQRALSHKCCARACSDHRQQGPHVPGSMHPCSQEAALRPRRTAAAAAAGADRLSCLVLLQVCLVHGAGQVSVLQYGSPRAMLAWPSAALRPAQLSLRLSAPSQGAPQAARVHRCRRLRLAQGGACTSPARTCPRCWHLPP